MIDQRGVWTAEAVGGVASFRTSPDRPVYGDRRWARYLGTAPRRRGPDPLLCLLVWARARGAPAAPSAAEFCRASGLPRPTFERRRRQAAAAIATGLNRQGERIPLDL